MGTGGLSLGVGPLCGENSGQHLYLPVQGARLSSLNAITIIVRDAPRKQIGLKVPAHIWMFSKKSYFLAGQCKPYVSFKLCEFILCANHQRLCPGEVQQVYESTLKHEEQSSAKATSGTSE